MSPDSSYLQVLALALLPALGNFAGRAVAELLKTSRRTLGRLLRVAVGVVVAVAAIELLPEALEGAAPWLVVLGFYRGRHPGWLYWASILEARPSSCSVGPSSTSGAVGKCPVLEKSMRPCSAMADVSTVVPFSIALVLAIGHVTALAFTAGLLILAATAEMLGEAHEVSEGTRYTAAFFIGGFALFTLVASYFEG